MSTLDWLTPWSPIEIRVKKQDGSMDTRRFNTHADAMSYVATANTAKAIYVEMNPFDPELIKDKGVDTESVIRRRRLLIDCDSERPPNTNATADEKQHALDLCRTIVKYLKTFGIEGAICDSGNGWHIILQIDLPNDSESETLCAAVLQALSDHFDTPDANVDIGTFDACRITTLYGTVTRKGPGTVDRPVRSSSLCSLPDPWTTVTKYQLEAIAANDSSAAGYSHFLKRNQEQKQSRYNVDAILKQLHVFYKRTKRNNVTFHIIRCPWITEHSTQVLDKPDGTVFTVGPNGELGFKCHHDCHLQTKHWPELRDLLGITPLTKHIVSVIKADDVEEVKLDWLWYARLAKGAVTLLEGNPEVGKSTILCDIAARISRGRPFPGEIETNREPGNVVMMIAEDDLGATVKPRLIGAGADLNRTFFLDRTKDDKGEIVPFHLSDDCEQLRIACEKVNAVCVMVDPLVSFLGSRKGKQLDTNNDLQVRKSLGPLKDLAEQLRSVVIAIRHYRKTSGTDAMMAGGGSIAFAALVRVILAALPNPQEEDSYYFAVAKNNLVAREKRPAIGYRIIPALNPDIGCIDWKGAVEMSANEILAAIVESGKDDSKVDEAVAWLLSVLANGEWQPVKPLIEAATNKMNISQPTLRRARAKIGDGIDVEQQPSIGKGWYWRLKPVPEPGY